jgi:signal transduction histidine kinase
MASSKNKTPWPASWEARYHQDELEKTAKGCRLLLILGLTLFPSFAILDIITQPAELPTLFAIRFGTTFLLFLIYLAHGQGWYPLKGKPVESAIGLLIIGGLSITLMCMHLGAGSEYYAGVNMVVLSAGIVIPWRPKHMALAVSTLILIYFLGVMASAGFRPGDPARIFSNMAFLVGIGVISVVSSALAETLRRESAARFFMLEEAQASLKSSRDLLARELEGGQKSLETLAQEMTERKHELEGALKRLQAAETEARTSLSIRDNFLSIASHELKTPLTSLRLQIQLASRFTKETASPALTRALDISLAQVKRITSLIEDLLDVTRIANGKLELRLGAVDLASLARQVTEQHRNLMESAGIELALDLEEEAIVEGDRERLEQVVVNLLTNASKYGKGRPVKVSVRQTPQGETWLAVADHGIGISAEHLEKIFERFERVEIEPGVSGLGLGLYISKNIVQSHRGQISVESELGKGTKFTVKLPCPPMGMPS